MKIATFPRLIKWMFTVGLTLLLLMIVMRFIFFYHFKPSQYSFANCINPFLLGLRFDLRIACAIVLIPFLAGSLHLDYTEKNRLQNSSIFRIVLILIILTVIILLLKNNHVGIASIITVSLIFILYLFWAFATKNCNPFKNKTSRKIFKIYFMVVSICLAFLYAMDFEHYDYLHQRLNASVLNYAADASISMNMIWETYPVFTIIFLLIVSVALLYWLINFYYRRFKQARFNGHGIIRIVMGFIFTFLLALGIFGRLNQYPLRWSDAFSFFTAISTVGVVVIPRSVTLNPQASNVLAHKLFTIAPLILPSRPIMIVPVLPDACSQPAYAALNFTISKGERLLPGLPPIVPLMPEILFISATISFLFYDVAN